MRRILTPEPQTGVNVMSTNLPEEQPAGMMKPADSANTVVAKRQNWWAAFSTSVDRFLKESRTFRG